MRTVLLAASLLAALPAAAAEPPGGERLRQELERTAEQLLQSLDRIMLELQDAARTLPRFEMPQMLENGDIIIRRRPPDPAENRRREKMI
jgi:hypothetical protein